MKCPQCGLMETSSVWDSRNYKNVIRRRRICKECNHRWITFEVHERYYKDPKTIVWSEGERITLVTLRERGLSYEVIGELLGRSTPSVKRETIRLTASGDYYSILEHNKIKA